MHLSSFFRNSFFWLLIATCLFPLSARAIPSTPDESDTGEQVSTGVVSLSGTEGQPIPPADVYARAIIRRIVDEGVKEVDGQFVPYQTVEAEIVSGEEQGIVITIENGVGFIIQQYQTVTVGETVVVTKSSGGGPDQPVKYYIVGAYRVPALLWLVAIFFGLAILFGRWRGLSSIVGLVFTIGVIFYGIIPHIIAGGDPLLTAAVGGFAIMVFSLYISHGFNRRTTIALISSVLLLGLAVGIDWVFVHFTKLTGDGTEEALYLQFANLTINLKGLLLGGIIIGVLGVLDDVTTGLAASIEEIYRANTEVTFVTLYRSGLSIGREHIASLVNTLVLAYAGASFPLLLLYTTNTSMPLWAIVNGSFLSEEIVRTLVGSVVLVLAVPLTTLLAASYYVRYRPVLK